MNFLSRLLDEYVEVSDFVVKNIKDVYIIYLESLADQDKINDYILKIIPKSFIPKDIKKLIPAPNVKSIKSYKDLNLYLNTGFTIIINKKQIIAVETKASLNRSVDKPSTEATLFGPKDSFVENYQTNLGLIKRRLKSSNLKDTTINIGKYTKTMCSVLYIDGVAKTDIVHDIMKKLESIDIDGVNDIGQLKTFLINENRNVFPGVKITERPDVITNALLLGKIVLILDNSPYALIVPAFLADFINPISDNYTKALNINFLKILRIVCFFIAIIVPAFYVAVTTINQETIPTELLINLQNQRIDVPFPALMECIMALLICEILRESDIRFPSSYGSAISILGGLVLGEAAVTSGIVSPIMIIVAAITFISSMIFTDQEVINGLRMWRFLFLFVASVFGLYGVGLSIILLFINLCNYEVFNKPYFYPVAPFDLTYLKETLIKSKNIRRSRYLSNNRIKERV
ncbi:MAG: spore germination protein [Erysipelotrichales bacterium]|nr:spore germination protein [Erysipelotrichales bacterium]